MPSLSLALLRLIGFFRNVDLFPFPLTVYLFASLTFCNVRQVTCSPPEFALLSAFRFSFRCRKHFLQLSIRLSVQPSARLSACLSVCQFAYGICLCSCCCNCCCYSQTNRSIIIPLWALSTDLWHTCWAHRCVYKSIVARELISKNNKYWIHIKV